MTPWIFVGIAILLLGATLRTWLEFGQRQRQLAAELHRLRSLVERHAQSLDRIRARTEDLSQETKRFVARREELHAKVLQERERLTGLEERLERMRPKSHRIENHPRDDTKEGWI